MPPTRFTATVNERPDSCPHTRVQGDNYGRTCLDCGRVLGGYGYFGQGRQTCLHHWVHSADPEAVECLYCQRTLKSALLD